MLKSALLPDAFCHQMRHLVELDTAFLWWKTCRSYFLMGAGFSLPHLSPLALCVVEIIWEQNHILFILFVSVTATD